MFLLQVIYNVYSCTETVDVKHRKQKINPPVDMDPTTPLIFDGKTFGKVQTVVFQ